MYLGEVVGAQGRQELQLKGAGMTPYSRGECWWAARRDGPPPPPP